MFRIHLVGIAPGGGLTPEAREIVRGCGCVVASSRHRPLVADAGVAIIPVAPVAAALTAMATHLAGAEVAVLASGDPLFFGIGRTLGERFGAERLVVHPALSSLQVACARFKEPWDDAKVVSLHGRDGQGLAARIMPHHKVFCFTDRQNSPDRVARALLDACEAMGDEELAAHYRVWVAENLGGADERLSQGSLAEIAARTFDDLNVMLLKRPKRDVEGEIAFGLGEAEIVHSRGLITKDEVRGVTLHQLRLPREGVFWDVGAGSGSISVEAGRLCPELQVFAVERKVEELANIRANCRKFGVYNLTVVSGEAPAALSGLPAPDRVFVGGSSGNLAGIIALAASRLKTGGRLVVNGVLDKTKRIAPELLHSNGLTVTIHDLAVQRRSFPDHNETTMNPIAIMVGEK
ncbi:MAG: precorrin-6y C5,15-methyltransferase (decarboxylating) subunit CbiE [Desulfobulbaceae bacterium]|nr:precorrin-6y C5,15-methyltransferase (decarboxylating) subunit CbiE [Desulfobulbaceae bacterium]